MKGGTDQSMCPTEREEYRFYETSNYTKCFAFFKDSKMTWSDAQKQCKNVALPKAGGELASIPDKATNDFLEKTLIEYGIKKILWTVGLKNESKNAWMWSGEMSQLNYSNWDPHDLDFGFADKKEKLGFGVDGQWRSLPSNFTYPFICQWTFNGITRNFIKMFYISIKICSDSSSS